MRSFIFVSMNVLHSSSHRDKAVLPPLWTTACCPQAAPGVQSHLNSLPGGHKQGHTNTPCDV